MKSVKSGFQVRGAERPLDPLAAIGLTVPIAALYPHLKSSAETLLRILAALSRDDSLLICARLNTIVSGLGADPEKSQEQALRFICNGEQIEKINQFAKRHGGSTRVTVFFRGQLLELTRYVAKYCQNLPSDGTTFEAPEVRSRFVQAALIAGDLWSSRVYGNRLSDHGTVEIARVRALGAFRKGVEESNAAPFFGETLGRGVSLFQNYFPRRYPAFNVEFLRATGLTPEEYFNCVAGMASLAISDRNDKPIFYRDRIGSTTAYRELFPRYLTLESQSPTDLAKSLWDDFAKAGYRALRERPILALNDGRSAILDPTFFSEKLSIGPLFMLLRNVKASKANEIFGAFGLAFEDYATDILKRMYPHTGGGLARRLSCNVKGHDRHGRDLEIDSLLNDVTQLVIFEMKAAWLREDAILDESHENYLTQLRAKYGVNPEKRERPKGVAQLARTVATIVRDDWNGPGDEFARAKLIYPVLVVHDNLLGAFGNGDFLEREFRTLLGETPPGKRVALLTVMTIQDLENLECSVGEFSLREFLFDYTNDSQGGIHSVHNYIAFSVYKDRLKPSADIRKNATELMANAQKALFPSDG